MTTLPQTAPLRLPRHPAGQAPGQLAHPAHVPVLHVPAAGAQLTPADVWRVIRSNLWLITLSLIVFGVGGYLVNRYILRPYYSRYESVGLCRVFTNAEIQGKMMTIMSPDAFDSAVRQEQATQRGMLQHESLLIDVLQDPQSKIRTTTWWNQFGNNVEKAKEDLLDHLNVVSIPDSRLIAVSMEYRVPDDCKTIVQEIVTQHLKRERARKNDEFIKQVGPVKDRVSNLEFNLDGLRRKIHDKAELLGQGASGGNSAKEVELTRLYDERIKITRDLAEARNKMQILIALNNTGQDPPGLDQKLSQDLTYNNLRQNVDKADTEMATSDVAPGHWRYARMKDTRDVFAQKLEDRRAEMAAGLFESLKSEYEASIDTDTKLLDDLKAQIERVSGEVSRSEADRRELNQLETEFQGLNRQWESANEDLSKLQSVSMTNEAANIDWARYPQTPDIPSFPKLPMVLTASIAVGLLLSLGIAFIRELTDNTVRTPQDIARVGNLNLLGMVPHENDDPQAAGARLPLVIFDAPHSMLAESFRQVRSRLQHAASLDTTRSLLVTSASAGDGKTTVAVNLAAGLALNGRRILLVDANFRRPALHEAFDTSNEYGFGDVLNSPEAFEQCVQATVVPNLSVLPSGQKPLNPTELLESQLLIDFIERAQEEYDHVIFDTGPLPLVSETIALAPRVDGVITVVRARANSRGLLQRVKDTLRQVKAEHVGVVLNAVRAQAGGYYGRTIVDYYRYQNGNGHVNGNGAGTALAPTNGNGRH